MFYQKKNKKNWFREKKRIWKETDGYFQNLFSFFISILAYVRIRFGYTHTYSKWMRLQETGNGKITEKKLFDFTNEMSSFMGTKTQNRKTEIRLYEKRSTVSVYQDPDVKGEFVQCNLNPYPWIVCVCGPYFSAIHDPYRMHWLHSNLGSLFSISQRTKKAFELI